jgi:hypothetical protein
MKSCLFYITEETDEMLNTMKTELGATRSASVIIAVKEHFKRVMKEDVPNKKLIKGE